MNFAGKNVVKNGAAVTANTAGTATLTGSEARDMFYVPAKFATSFVADVRVTATVVATGVTLKLQTRFSKDEAWQDSAAAITVANGFTGVKTFRLLDTVAGDQQYLPLRPEARIVAVTGAGDSITVDAVWVPGSVH